MPVFAEGEARESESDPQQSLDDPTAAALVAVKSSVEPLLEGCEPLRQFQGVVLCRLANLSRRAFAASEGVTSVSLRERTIFSVVVRQVLK